MGRGCARRRVRKGRNCVRSAERGATARPRRTLQLVRDESFVLRAMISPWRVLNPEGYNII